MNSQTVDIADILNSISTYIRTFLLDNLVAQKEAYHNYLFEALKEQRVAIIFILLFYTLLCMYFCSTTINRFKKYRYLY